jgi:hypothetical protein
VKRRAFGPAASFGVFAGRPSGEEKGGVQMKKILGILAIALFCWVKGSWAQEITSDFVKGYLVSNDFYTLEMLEELSFEEVFGFCQQAKEARIEDILRQYQGDYRRAYLAWDILLVSDWLRGVSPPGNRPVRPSPRYPCGCPK